MRFVLVRHCRTAVDPATPASTWGLTATGRRQADELAESPWLRDAAVLTAGPEPKMTETLGPLAATLGLEVVTDEAFRETDARWLPTDDFTAAVERLFGSPTASPAPGWERSCDAGDRFLSGPQRIDGAGQINGSLTTPNVGLR